MRSSSIPPFYMLPISRPQPRLSSQQRSDPAGFYCMSEQPRAMRIASEACVPEILRDAGPEGLHIKDIAALTCTDVNILGRALRLLCTQYVFKEAVHADSTDDQLKASAFLPDSVLRDDHLKRASFLAAMNQPDNELWDFMRRFPEYSKRFQMLMVGRTHLTPHKMDMQGFRWADLPTDSLVIDVGTGNGSEAARIAKLAPQLKIIGQDLPDIINDVTRPRWNSDPLLKPMVDSESMSAQVQFEAVTVFYLRYIIHIWLDEASLKILRKLHAAASDDTTLIIVDEVVPYACATPDSLVFDGMNRLDPPAPLLPNLGQANSEVYLMDMTMAVMTAGQERTIGQFDALTKKAGWQIINRELELHNFRIENPTMAPATSAPSI
ncbi:S-adenosyl-L-methionine-dependent methyltransferase [Schizophyllum commune Loenen D]|nr:S-adenosyl-L-methionine-dependent methyltransferase [Schizophyllum commune Loenen D]